MQIRNLMEMLKTGLERNPSGDREGNSRESSRDRRLLNVRLAGGLAQQRDGLLANAKRSKADAIVNRTGRGHYNPDPDDRRAAKKDSVDAGKQIRILKGMGHK